MGGPEGVRDSVYALDTEWDVMGKKDIKFSNITIKTITRAYAEAHMKPPASEGAWAARGIRAKWKRTWQIKPKYVTPRDTAAWLKLQHRNL